MEIISPAEVARLVYGYLMDKECFRSANLFLETCPLLNECLPAHKNEKPVSCNVSSGLSLEEIIQDHCDTVCTLSDYQDPNRTEKSTNLTQRLKSLIHGMDSNKLIAGQQDDKAGCGTLVSDINSSKMQQSVYTCDELTKGARKSSDLLMLKRSVAQSNISSHAEMGAECSTSTALSNHQETISALDTECSSIKRRCINSTIPCFPDVPLRKDLESSHKLESKSAMLFFKPMLEDVRLHEKIAETVNRVMGNISTEEDAADAPYELNKSFNSAIHSVVKQTEADPLFLRLLNDIFVSTPIEGCSTQLESSSDEDYESQILSFPPIRSIMTPYDHGANKFIRECETPDPTLVTSENQHQVCYNNRAETINLKGKEPQHSQERDDWSLPESVSGSKCDSELEPNAAEPIDNIATLPPCLSYTRSFKDVSQTECAGTSRKHTKTRPKDQKTEQSTVTTSVTYQNTTGQNSTFSSTVQDKERRPLVAIAHKINVTISQRHRTPRTRRLTKRQRWHRNKSQPDRNLHPVKQVKIITPMATSKPTNTPMFLSSSICHNASQGQGVIVIPSTLPLVPAASSPLKMNLVPQPLNSQHSLSNINTPPMECTQNLSSSPIPAQSKFTSITNHNSQTNIPQKIPQKKNCVPMKDWDEDLRKFAILVDTNTSSSLENCHETKSTKNNTQKICLLTKNSIIKKSVKILNRKNKKNVEKKELYKTVETEQTNCDKELNTKKPRKNKKKEEIKITPSQVSAKQKQSVTESTDDYNFEVEKNCFDFNTEQMQSLKTSPFHWGNLISNKRSELSDISDTASSRLYIDSEAEELSDKPLKDHRSSSYETISSIDDIPNFNQAMVQLSSDVANTTQSKITIREKRNIVQNKKKISNQQVYDSSSSESSFSLCNQEGIHMLTTTTHDSSKTYEHPILGINKAAVDGLQKVPKPSCFVPSSPHILRLKENLKSGTVLSTLQNIQNESTDIKITGIAQVEAPTINATHIPMNTVSQVRVPLVLPLKKRLGVLSKSKQ